MTKPHLTGTSVLPDGRSDSLELVFPCERPPAVDVMAIEGERELLLNSPSDLNVFRGTEGKIKEG